MLRIKNKEATIVGKEKELGNLNADVGRQIILGKFLSITGSLAKFGDV